MLKYMAPLNDHLMRLEDKKLYDFRINSAFPVQAVTYKNTALHKYIYTYNNQFHMEVLMLHDDDGVPELLHTFTLNPVDYIPLVSEMKKELSGLPQVITITKKTPIKSDPTKFHNYEVEVEY